MIKRVICLLSLILSSIAFYGQDFEVSPVKLMFYAEPGSSQIRTLVVKNHGNSTSAFLLSSGDYIINSQGKREYVPANTNKRSISSWMTISPTFFEVPPNQEQIVSISVQPPIDEFGSRWGVIYVRTAAEKMTFEADKTLSAGMQLSPRIMVDVIQTSQGHGQLSVKIDQLRETSSNNPEKRMFTALVTNNNDIILQCKSYLILSNMQTNVETIYSPINFELYPKNTRRIDFELPSGLEKGLYALAAILDYGSNSTLEGTQIVIEF